MKNGEEGNSNWFLGKGVIPVLTQISKKSRPKDKEIRLLGMGLYRRLDRVKKKTKREKPASRIKR